VAEVKHLTFQVMWNDVLNGTGSVADLFVERERASAMAAYVVGPLFGKFTPPALLWRF
jgi:hypothetical protein